MREALKLALEALQKIYIAPEHEEYIRVWWPACEQAITAIKEALAQPEPPPECQTEAEKTAFAFGWFKAMEAQRLAQTEQEPVAWMEKDVLPLTHIIKAIVRREKDETYTEPLYTTPPQRTWVGLTPQERDEINEQVYGAVPHHVAFHAAIEAKLKEKNT